jgi:DNA-binding transcriptional ArsR family regulator
MPSTDSPAELDLRRLRGVYRAIGDISRLRVISALASEGQVTVSGLSQRVGLSQPLISWHLRILRLAGVIETRRSGREVLCRLRREAFEELHAAESELLAGVPETQRRTLQPTEEPADVG